MATDAMPGEGEAGRRAAAKSGSDGTGIADSSDDTAQDSPNGASDTSPVSGHPVKTAASSGAAGAGLTAMLVAMVLFIRIMAVSGWDWGTAAELADAFDFGDAVPIFFGTLFELPLLTGIAAAVILPLACYRLYLVQRSPDVYSKITDWLIIALLGIVLYVLQRSYGLWWPIALTAVLAAAITVFVILVHRGRMLQLLDTVSRRVGTVFIVVLLVLAVVVTTPWNPREEIGLKDQVVNGHVIETSPGFLKILTDDREVLVVLTQDVQYRKTVEIPE